MAIHDHLWPRIAKCHQSFVENKIGARKKPLAKSQAAFGVEDNGTHTHFSQSLYWKQLATFARSGIRHQIRQLLPTEIHGNFQRNAVFLKAVAPKWLRRSAVVIQTNRFSSERQSITAGRALFASGPNSRTNLSAKILRSKSFCSSAQINPSIATSPSSLIAEIAQSTVHGSSSQVE